MYTPDTAINNYLANQKPNTRIQFRRILKEWCGFLGCDPLAANTNHIRRFLAFARLRPAQPGRSAHVKATVSDATVYRKLKILCRLYDVLLDCGFIQANPWHTVRTEMRAPKTGDRRAYELVDYSRVEDLIRLAGCDKEGIRDRAIMVLLFGAALRRSELVRLKIEDVTTEKGTMVLVLRDTKSGAGQKQVLHWKAEHVADLVDQRRREGASNSDWLLVRYIGYPQAAPGAGPLSSETVYRTFKRYCEKAGLPATLSPHCARATAITKLLDDGVTHREVREFSRHETIAMVERYDKRRTSIENAVAKKLSY